MIREENEFKDVREMVTFYLEQMTNLKIMLKEKNEFYAEPSYRLNPEFTSKLAKHIKIQEEIESVDKKRQIDSVLDYGGMTKDHYIIGITINDFIKATPIDCKKCQAILKMSVYSNSMEEFLVQRHKDRVSEEKLKEHMKNEHSDLNEIQETLDKYLLNWISLIEGMIKGNNKEWRSKI